MAADPSAAPQTGETHDQGPVPAPPSINLPKGGGAIRGIDEKLAVNPSTGTASLSIPLPLSSSRSASEPQMVLRYDSGSGNGTYGYGLNLNLPAIARRTDKLLPTYRDEEEADVFVLSGAEDLVPVTGGSSDRTVGNRHYRVDRYRPRIEGNFARIERWTRLDDGDVHWRTTTRENVTSLFGTDESARIFDEASGRPRVFAWLLVWTIDSSGNAIAYAYKPEDAADVQLGSSHELNRPPAARRANRYLKSVRYGNRRSALEGPEGPDPEWMFELVFDYGEHDATDPRPGDSGTWPCRLDPFSSYRAGFEVRTYRLCRRVLMFHHFPDEEVGRDCLVRSFTFTYRGDPVRGQALGTCLASVVEAGHRRDPAGGYVERTFPALEFEFVEAQLHDEIHAIDPASLEGLTSGVPASSFEWVDLDGEGLSGILAEAGGWWFYKRNRGAGRFAAPSALGSLPTGAELRSGRRHLTDLDGDGALDLVTLGDPSAGYSERTAEGSWSTFRSFESLPNVRWDDPNLRLVDLNGDGHPDVLVTEDSALTWYPSLAERGFGPARRVPRPHDERAGPALVFADREGSIFLADMSGDGLADLARIRNGNVSYWPNSGGGTFGRKVSMDRAPTFDRPDEFDHRRLRLVDIDGSGTTDIVYLGTEGASIYRNESGNAWAAATLLRTFPVMDETDSVSAVDLFGIGTACLVWSSPLPSDSARSIRYVDLMGGRKPHVLSVVRNNMGAETTLTYAPSTRFYLEDAERGRPWATRLPFPVQVVERVDVADLVGRTRFVSRYAYHHGFFDGVEREFRGFGLVEQWDTEELPALTEQDDFAASENLDEASYVPPVLTRTWFDTGAQLGPVEWERLFADAHVGYGVLAPLRARMPARMDPDEAREASRALKGSVLRREVLSCDGTPRQHLPYLIGTWGCEVARVQPKGSNRHGVFFVHPSESLTAHIERDPADPRVTHELTLEVDEFGNVLAAAAVAYGRRRGDDALIDAERAAQSRTLATYTENEVTNAIDEDDARRTPIVCGSRSYELPLGELRLDDARESRRRIGELASRRDELRLFAGTRTLFRRDDLAGPLPFGQVESLALQFEQYRLVLSDETVAEVYGDRVDETVLTDEGGYVPIEGGWWAPGGRVFYAEDANAEPEEEFRAARSRFFLPARYVDPFGSTTSVRYDRYVLLVLETSDAAGNRVTAGERGRDERVEREGLDYRVLRPRLVMDANRNRSAVLYDARGFVVGTAVSGKPEERLGDTVEGLDPDVDEELTLAYLRSPLEQGRSLLGRSTSRIVYDLFAYQRMSDTDEPQPAVVGLIQRVTHDAELRRGQKTAVQHTFSYSDGRGRELQRTAQASPGPTDDGGPSVDPRWIRSGWQILNNKGKVVRRYEPAYSATHAFEFAAIAGVSSVQLYDPLLRVVATLHPDHTYQRVVFHPWRQEAWDANDTVAVTDPRADEDVRGYFARIPAHDFLPAWITPRRSGELGPEERRAAEGALVHARTPSVHYVDPLGRAILSVEANRAELPEGTLAEKERERTELDIQGNPVAVVDPLGRTAMRAEYDQIRQELLSTGIDTGTRRTLYDVMGKALYSWSPRGFRRRTRFDALRRPVETFVRGPRGTETLAERTVYGETNGGEAGNRRGRIASAYDSAGVVTYEHYDFKGNEATVTRQLTAAGHDVVDWSEAVELAKESWASTSSFDALNRVRRLQAPDGTRTYLRYDKANLVENVTVRAPGKPRAEPFVSTVDYDASGRRMRIEYGNGAVTSYEYDPKTFRLARLRTVRPAGPRRSGRRTVQDLAYTYDPVGNVTQIVNAAQDRVFFANSVVEAGAEYVYDARYRLLEASGREHVGQAGGAGAVASSSPFDRDAVGQPHPGDGRAMARYVERYRYDAVGNFIEVVHRRLGSAGGGWRRRNAYEEPSVLEPDRRGNRLSRVDDGTDAVERYSYDEHGNTVALPHLALIEWDYEERLRASASQIVTEGVPETTYAAYDLRGQRVRKVTERRAGPGETPTTRCERLYLGGFELYREHGADGAVVLERSTLHVTLGEQRIALVERRTQGDDGTPSELVRYQLGDHLGSATVELDDRARVISYEEYSPYGATTYQGVRAERQAPKRYRWSGKERDEETGLSYFGARYYAPWLGRWISPDPKWKANRYEYAGSNPVAFYDPNGAEEATWSNRLWGGVQMIGGAAQAVVGAAVFVQIEVPVAAQVVGGVALFHGLDDVVTGAKQMITGRKEKTVTHQVAEGTAKLAGASEPTANAIGTGVDMTAGLVSPSGGATKLPGLALATMTTGETMVVVRTVTVDTKPIVETSQVIQMAMATNSGGPPPSSSSSSNSSSSSSSSSSSTPGNASDYKKPSNSTLLKGDRATARADAIADLWQRRQSGQMTQGDIHTLERLETEHGAEAVVKFEETGELPKNFEFSHLYSAAEYPELASKSELGVLTDHSEHIYGHHGGDTRVPLDGQPRDVDWAEKWGYQVTDDSPEGMSYAGMVCK